jgi:hypothetical protein
MYVGNFTMENPGITFIINGNTYSLRATDLDSIDKIEKVDRQDIIALLEVIKRQEQISSVAVQRTADDLKARTQTASSVSNQGDGISPIAEKDIEVDRLSGSQVDDLMARLIMEEKKQTKPGLTRSGVYKFVGGSAIIVIIFILVL